MLYFLVTKRHAYTMEWFLAEWGKELEPLIRIIPYKSLMTIKKLHPGLYIFSDIERISPHYLKRLDLSWQSLNDSPLCQKPLNRPLKVKKRLELLNTLHEAGINDFNAYPITAGQNPRPERFPVFIREANDHAVPTTVLINNQAELDECINKMSMAGQFGGNPIVTEFTSVMGSDGLYYKYGAFCIGGRIIPGYINAGDHWMVKLETSTLDEKLMAENLAYVESNPHEKELKKIFQLANIDYGRIDYGLCNGRIQVFEINTNPTILMPRKPKQFAHQQRKRYVADQLIAAFRHLDAQATPG